MPNQILVVDDFVLLCEGLVRLIHDERDLKVAATASSAEDACRLADELRPALVLVDAVLASGNDFATLDRMAGLATPPRVVVLDDRFTAVRVQSALDHGAQGYVLRTAPFRVLADCLREALAGRLGFCPEISGQVIQSPTGFRVSPTRPNSPLALLTRRELEVLRCLARGMSVRKAAEHLKLAESTVDNHKSRMMRKLKVRKTVELTRIAIHEGIVDT